MKRWQRWSLIGIGFAFAILLIAALSMPVYDGPYKRQHANDAATVGTIRTINFTQVTYASRNGRFTCDLADLTATADKEHLVFSENGERVGHVFSLRGCVPGPRNPKYQVIAVPKEPGVTGFKAFCSDQSGVIYYDAAGYGEQCLERKKSIH